MMSFSIKTTQYFDDPKNGGQPKQAEKLINQQAGHADRSCINLFFSLQDGLWQANYQATGGVALIAACEYWARKVNEDNANCKISAKEIMEALDIDKKWLSDIILIEQASTGMQEQQLNNN